MPTYGPITTDSFVLDPVSADAVQGEENSAAVLARIDAGKTFSTAFEAESIVLDPTSENAVVVPAGVGASTVGFYPPIAAATIATVGGDEDTNLDTFVDAAQAAVADPVEIVYSQAVGAVAVANAVNNVNIADNIDAPGTVIGVTITAVAPVTADATNYRTFRVINESNSNAVVATFATDTPITDDLAAGVAKALTLGAAGDLKVKPGDVLAADETVAAAGVAHGGYTVRVTVSS